MPPHTHTRTFLPAKSFVIGNSAPSQRFEFRRRDVRLVENTPKRTHANLGMPRHDAGEGSTLAYSNKFYMASMLTDFSKTSRFQPPFDLAELHCFKRHARQLQVALH